MSFHIFLFLALLAGELNLKSYEEAIQELLRSEKRIKKIIFWYSWACIEYFKGSAAGEKAKEIIENSEDKVIVGAVNIAEVYNSFLWDYIHPDNKRYAEASKKACQSLKDCNIPGKVKVPLFLYSFKINSKSCYLSTLSTQQP